MSGLRVRSSMFGGDSSLEWVDPASPLRFEVRPNDDGTIDEVLIYAGERCLFHLEQLDDDAYWFAWYGPDEQHFDIRRHGKRVTITDRAARLLPTQASDSPEKPP